MSPVWDSEAMEYLTVEEVLEATDSLKPNSFCRGEKIAWLSSLDGQLYNELVPTHKGLWEAFSPYGIGDGARRLFVPQPYGRELYLAWLESRMDHYNGDTVRYNNAMDRFALAYRDFTRWFNRTYSPVDHRRKYW